MAVSTYEAQRVNVSFTGEDGFTVMTTGNKSDSFESAYHFTVDATGDYIGMVIVKGAGKERRFLAYDGVGDLVVGDYKTMLGIVKRLHTFAERRRKATLEATAPISCDACGYDIATDDDEAQSTEVAGEAISTCGGCADEIGTLVLDAQDGKLNREAPRGARPVEDEDEDADDGSTSIEQVLDRLAVSLSLAGPVLERLRKSVVDDDEPELRAAVRDYIDGVEYCEHGTPVGSMCGTCLVFVTPSRSHYQGCQCYRCKVRRGELDVLEPFRAHPAPRFVSYEEVNVERLGLRAKYV